MANKQNPGAINGKMKPNRFVSFVIQRGDITLSKPDVLSTDKKDRLKEIMDEF